MRPGYRIVILTAAMGGGHVQVSREMQRRLTYMGHAASVVDVLDFTPRWGPFVAWLYPWMVSHTPWLYDWIYRFFFLHPQTDAGRASIPVRLSLPGLRRLLSRERPDLVLSTYHLAGVAAAHLRRRGELQAPAVTFVTTFGVHDLWLHPGTDMYLCITKDVATRLSQRTPAPVEVCEPVVRPQFASRLPVGTAGSDRRSPKVALLVAGSLGMGPVRDAVTAVAAIPGWRPVVVCGSNEELRRDLESAGDVEVHGWVDDMASLMASSDVVIDNAGGSTAKEALACGCPVVTFRPIPGHGRHDALMMQEAGLTEVVDDEVSLRRALEAVTDPERLAQRVARGRSLFGADPARLVVDWLEGRGAGQDATRDRE